MNSNCTQCWRFSPSVPSMINWRIFYQGIIRLGNGSYSSSKAPWLFWWLACHQTDWFVFIQEIHRDIFLISIILDGWIIRPSHSQIMTIHPSHSHVFQAFQAMPSRPCSAPLRRNLSGWPDGPEWKGSMLRKEMTCYCKSGGKWEPAWLSWQICGTKCALLFVSCDEILNYR